MKLPHACHLRPEGLCLEGPHTKTPSRWCKGYLLNILTPPKTNMEPESSPLAKGETSTNQQFLGSMLVFRGVTLRQNAESWASWTFGKSDVSIWLVHCEKDALLYWNIFFKRRLMVCLNSYPNCPNEVESFKFVCGEILSILSLHLFWPVDPPLLVVRRIET